MASATSHDSAEEALREANRRLRDVLESITEGYVVLDESFHFVEVNPAALRMAFHDRPVEDLLGRKLWDLYPEGRATEFYRQYHRAFAENLPVHFEGYSVIVDRWFETHVYPRGGRLEIYIRDITARKRAEEALAQSLAQLREAEQRKDEFLAMLSHELRNPLAPIRMAVHLLRHTDLPPDKLAWITAMLDRQSSHLTRLVDDLLDVSRVTRGAINLRFADLDLADVIASAVETSRPLLDARGHALTVALPPEPVRLRGDAARLSQVLSNLLNNAAKYTPDGGRVELRAWREGDDAVCAVRDDGAGIAPDVLPRVFELFAQAQRTADRAEGGLGIGLTVVERLVAMHGGAVEARSEGVGRGSEFVVRLPLAGPPPR